MVREIPEEIKRRVTQLWLQGMTYRDIHAKVGPEIGTISGIISEERKRIPDLDDLRELDVELRSAKLSLAEALRGSFFLEKLNVHQIQIDNIAKLVSLVEKYGDKAGDLLDSALRLSELEARESKTYEVILAEAAEKVKAAADLTVKIEGLRSQHKALTSSIRELEKLKVIEEKLDKHGLTPERLDTFVEHELRLEALGFTTAAAEILAAELSKIGLDPRKAAEEVATLIKEYGSAQEALTTTKAEARKAESELKKTQMAIEGKKKEIDSMEGNLQVLRNQVDTWEKVSAEKERIYSTRAEELEKNHKERMKEIEKEEEARITALEKRYETREKILAESLEDKMTKGQKEISILKGEVEQLKSQEKELSSDKKDLETAISKAAEEIPKLKEELESKRPILIASSIMDSGDSPSPPHDVVRTYIGFSEGLKTYIGKHADYFPNETPQLMQDLMLALVRVLRDETKASK